MEIMFSAKELLYVYICFGSFFFLLAETSLFIELRAVTKEICA